MNAWIATITFLSLAVIVSATALSAGPLQLKVDAGPYDRVGTLLRWEIPASMSPKGDVFRLVSTETGRAVAAQRDGDALAWVLGEPLKAGESRTLQYRHCPWRR